MALFSSGRFLANNSHRFSKILLHIRFDASVPHYLSALRAKAALLSNRPARPLRVRPVRGRRTLCLPAPDGALAFKS